MSLHLSPSRSVEAVRAPVSPLTASSSLACFRQRGTTFKTLLRDGKTDAEITDFIRSLWRAREDRYSEQRFEALHSNAGYRAEDHRKIEMISLGG